MDVKVKRNVSEKVSSDLINCGEFKVCFEKRVYRKKSVKKKLFGETIFLDCLRI